MEGSAWSRHTAHYMLLSCTLACPGPPRTGMGDEWSIKSLSQTIEDDEEEDLVPTTPSQEDIDITAPSTDSTSLLADTHGPGRRKVPQTLSLGLPEDPESESLPFLPLEWEPQFPVTPAQENGHSPVDRFLKGRVDSPTEDRDFDMTLGSCNGQGEPLPGCSAIWATRSASEVGVVREASGGNGSGDGSSTSSREKAAEDATKQETAKDGEKDTTGGEEGTGSGGQGGGDQGKGGDKGGKKRSGTEEEEEESSHEPSSDSSEGVAMTSTSRDHKQEGEGVGPPQPQTGVAPTSESGREKAVESQDDLFASQEAELPLHPLQREAFQPPDPEPEGLTVTPATTIPILQLSQEEEEARDPLIIQSPPRMLADTPACTGTSPSSPSSPHVQLSPLKRKRRDSETPFSESDTAQVPLKLRKTEPPTSCSSESGEEPVNVGYKALTSKDVEISPKQIHPPLRASKPPPRTSTVRSLTFQSSSSSDEPCEGPLRLPVDTEAEEESSDKERFSAPVTEGAREDNSASDKQGESERGSDVKLAIRSFPMPMRMHASPGGESGSQSSEKDDSDVEILEDDPKNRSVEVVYEKPKGRLSLESGMESQDLNLVLESSTQPDPLFRDPASQDRMQSESEPHLRLSGSEPPQPMDRSPVGAADCVEGTMPATQIEKICKPAILTQPDIESLITLPLQDSQTKGKPTQTTVGVLEEPEREKSSQSEAESQEKQETQEESSPPDDSQPSQASLRLQMPNICTPSSQECQHLPESESMFVKVSKAANKRLHQEELLTADTKKEEKSFEVITDSSLEITEVDKTGEDLSTKEASEGRSIEPESGSNSSTTVYPLTPSRSYQSTPFASQHLKSSQTTSLLGSGRKEGSQSAGSTEGTNTILVEKTDSEDEGTPHRKRKKLRPPAAKALLSKRGSQPQDVEEKEAAASPPNTSEGVSLSVSNADKEASKSHTTSPEEGSSAKSVTFKSPDTQALEAQGPFNSMLELMRAGFRETRTLRPAVEYVHPESSERLVLTRDGSQVLVCTVLSVFHNSSSGSSSSSSRRISDVSSLSTTTSSSGYLGDKSSSSSGSSRRTSIISSIESSRLSIGSVVTLSSPPRPQKEAAFLVPAVGSRGQVEGDSPKVVEQVCLDSPPKKTAGPAPSSNDGSPRTPSRRGRGRARGRPRGREASRGTSRRGRGRGRGRAVVARPSDDSDTDDEDAFCPPNSPNPPEQDNEELPPGLSDLRGSLPPEVWRMLQASQAPLSEEEEEAFVGRVGGDSEQQLAHILRRVREVELEPDLLVFARFTDNKFYSAVLRDRDGTDRWHVQFTLDQYEASVREVYLLPTALLPRGQACYVRQHSDSEHYSDMGVVKGHIRVGSTILHIVETDRGATQRVPHSHLLLSGAQAHHMLQARHNFRSMVASPGRDVSLDNIVAGRRRRQQQDKQFYSPRSKKADDNLDTSEATAGEGDELHELAGSRTPSSRKAARGRNLYAVAEESDAEVTPKKRRLGTTPRGSRTPRGAHRNRGTARTLMQERDCQLQEELAAQVEVMHSPLLATPPKKRGRPPGQSSSTLTPVREPKLDDMPEDPSLGPLPPVGSQMFKGYTILMTSGDSSIRKNQSLDNENLPPFDKEYMAAQIRRGSGNVLEKYSEAEIILAEQGTSSSVTKMPQKTKKKSGCPSSSNTTLLLISNTHCRTAKYIQCLASGVPIVSFQWVINSCKQNKALPWKLYLLPSGEQESGEVCEQNLLEEEEGGFLMRRYLLSGQRIFLGSSDNSEFCPLWQPLLDSAGAKVRVRPRTGNLNRVLDKSMTLVVGDSSLPQDEEQRARQLGLPVVSTEWVIQSLIQGTQLSHESFLRPLGRPSGSSARGEN
ncbi:TP53-binding protein 1-like isoform X2 [Portunus trituberculatus]|uniref:TP53-binding protein 1-like isoform X2 n=1 Tax=Portunus trituberculatus TaxID=210409 RepID=UPI001E1D20A1|nr:TP53-binding protein 1-like isoform X2 [Portunus trituberculatus]